MEVLLAYVAITGMYGFLLIYFVFTVLKLDRNIILGISFSLIWSIQNILSGLNINVDPAFSLNSNPNISLLMYYGWFIYLQSLYLSIPGLTKAKRIYVILVNIVLIGLFLFLVRLQMILGGEPYNSELFNITLLLISIAMLFYLENIVRYLKARLRYHNKHQFFILGALAILLFLHSFLTLITDSQFQQLELMLIFIHLLIPVFLFISAQRNASHRPVEFDRMRTDGETQYLMVLIGTGLFLLGGLETIRLFIDGSGYLLLKALLGILILGLLGIFILSNIFRSFLVTTFRSYFYRDRNDYKREWERINAIINNKEEDIYDGILKFYIQWAGCDRAALYLIDNRQKPTLVARYGNIADLGNGFNVSYLTQADQKQSDLYWFNHFEGGGTSLFIGLAIDQAIMAICWIPQFKSIDEIDDAEISLCESASNTFAIRLRDLQQKRQITRQQKIIGFNKTIAFLAHDLKNIAAQQQLAMENFPGNRHDADFLDDFGSTISHSTSRLLKLIEQFNLSTDKDEQTRGYISISTLLADIKSQVGYMPVRFNCIHIDVNMNDQVDNRVVSIITNLIKNACEASSPASQVNVTVSVEGSELLLKVVDQGEGMTKDFIDNFLFEPFVSLKGSDGLGIGMFQVQEIINELEGDIHIESKLGQGTAVTVRLPLGEGQQ